MRFERHFASSLPANMQLVHAAQPHAQFSDTFAIPGHCRVCAEVFRNLARTGGLSQTQLSLQYEAPATQI